MDHHIRLPPGHFVEDGRIVRRWMDKKGNHEEIVACGTIEVLSVGQYVDNLDEMFVTVRFVSNTAVRFQDVRVPIKQITGDGKRLLDYVPDWFILLGPSPAKRRSFLQQTLAFQRAEIEEVVKVQRVGTGYHTSDNGTLFYVFGDIVLNRPTGLNLEVTPTFHLRNQEGPLGKGVSWVRRFCEQGPPQAAQLVATLAAYLRPIFEATNSFNRFGVYVLGESGTGKSETAKLLCSLFEETSGATLSSDKADLFLLMSTYRDMPFLVDDLNNSGIASATHKKQERLSEIIQQMSGTGILSIRGEVFDVGRTTPIITAETLLTNPSTINRVLIIRYDKSFNADDMTWLQQNHGLYLDFLKCFIKWVCQNHTWLEACVRSWDFSHLDDGIKNPDAFVGFHRLKRTFTILKITLELLLLHLCKVYSIPPKDEKSWRQLLEEGINQAVFSDTLEHLRKDSKTQDRTFVEAVLDIFDDEQQWHRAKDRLVAASYNQYVRLNKEARIDERVVRKIFFLSDDEKYYRFRGNDLLQYLTNQSDIHLNISKKAISAQLDHFGLLHPYGGELSYPVAEDSDHHYYSLRRSVVEELQKERQEEFFSKVSASALDIDAGDVQRLLVRRR